MKNLSLLFDRDICKKFNFIAIMAEKCNSKKQIAKEKLFYKYSEFVPLGYTSSIRQKVKLKVYEDCIPLFYKPRSVPFRCRCFLQQKLANSDCDGIIEKMDHKLNTTFQQANRSQKLLNILVVKTLSQSILVQDSKMALTFDPVQLFKYSHIWKIHLHMWSSLTINSSRFKRQHSQTSLNIGINKVHHTNNLT